MSDTSSAARVFAIPELLERILLMAPMKEAFIAQRVSKDFRNTTSGSKKLQQRFFLLPCDKTPQEALYGDGKLDSEIRRSLCGPDDEDEEELPDFVHNPLLDLDYKWLLRGNTERSEYPRCAEPFASHVDVVERYSRFCEGEEEDLICLSCDCLRVHTIPVPRDEIGLGWPGNPEIFARPKKYHSWRQMVFSQPTNRKIRVKFWCRGETMCYDTFPAGTKMGKLVDKMEKRFRKHQTTGERCD